MPRFMLYIWGAGEKGERIFRHLEAENVIAFVDSNRDRTGKMFLGKDVISVEQYLEKYSDFFIIIAHSDETQAVKILESREIYNYFRLSDCPGELQEPNSRNHLRKYIEDYLNNREDYVLYGITLYSILIDQWIYSKYGIHPQIIPQNTIKKEKLEKLCVDFNELGIIAAEKAKKSEVKEVDIVISDISPYIKAYLEERFYCVDLYDCSDRIEAYKNSEIEKFRNMHRNERCFIVATGPSLRSEDLDILEKNGEIAFSVNGIFHAFQHTKWRPTYYVSDDYRAINNNSEMIDGIAREAAFIGDTYAPFWEREHPRSVYKFHKHYEYYYDKGPKFTDDFAQKSYTGLTVTYTCIQLAVYMGFKEIYLLGVDCNYISGSDSNYFFKSGKKDSINHETDKTVMAYQSAKRYADEHNIKIYNATRGGMLEVFERVDFDSLFGYERG